MYKDINCAIINKYLYSIGLLIIHKLIVKYIYYSNTSDIPDYSEFPSYCLFVGRKIFPPTQIEHTIYYLK